MKISIITATYNSAVHITGCLASVNNQSFKNTEHIIVDGASTDNTQEIIKSTPNRVSQLISEPDNGIYDALNKGIQHATGDVIGFLHADDRFASPNTVESIVKGFSPLSGEMSVRQRGRNEKPKPEIHGIYGHLVFVNNENKVLRTWHSKPFHKKNVRHGWMPPHPTLFLRKEVYKKHGLFDTTFKIAGDYDFMLRVMTDPEMHLRYLPEVITRMRLGGASTGSVKGIVLKMQEDIRALRNTGFNYPLSILAAKNLRKLPQLLRR
jgi:glycosyltransferase